MLLYNYTPLVPHSSLIRVHYGGNGLGSVFARLFSKIAAKTAAKAALSAAKVASRKAISVATKQGMHAAKIAGRKALKVATTHGTKFAKKAVKKGIKKATEYGTEAAIHGIDALSQSAINKGVPESAVHNVSNFVKEGTQSAANKLKTTAVKKVNSGIDNITGEVNTRFGEEKERTRRPLKRKSNSGGYQTVKKKKKTIHKRKRNREKTLSTLIDEA